MARFSPIESKKPQASLERQQARCVFVTLALGNALLDLPQDFNGTKRDCAAMDRIVRWHGRIAEECSLKKLPPFNGQAVVGRMKKFFSLSSRKGLGKAAADRLRVASFWACVILVWDVRVTCPAYGRTLAWRYLDLAADQLVRSLLAAYEGADQAGENIYLELAW